MSGLGQVKTLTPTVGAEVRGVDLRSVSDKDVELIERALLDHGVVFFRDQDLTLEQHIAFGRRFGKLHVHPYVRSEPDYPEIVNLRSELDTKSNEWLYDSLWHSDITCDPEPPMGAILFVRKIPANGGGDTMFASMYAAFDALSEPMRAFLSPLKAIHGSAKLYQVRGKAEEEVNKSEHPVVRTHPVTGRQALYVNSIFTKRIVGLEPYESDALLQMLFRHIESPRHQCRFKWEAGSIAFWDNRATQHRPIGDYEGFIRHAQRVTLCGDRPFHNENSVPARAAD